MGKTSLFQDILPSPTCTDLLSRLCSTALNHHRLMRSGAHVLFLPLVNRERATEPLRISCRSSRGAHGEGYINPATDDFVFSIQARRSIPGTQIHKLGGRPPGESSQSLMWTVFNGELISVDASVGGYDASVCRTGKRIAFPIWFRGSLVVDFPECPSNYLRDGEGLFFFFGQSTFARSPVSLPFDTFRTGFNPI